MLTLDSWVQLPKSGEKNDVTARPAGMALTADGKTIYVALNMNNTLGLFDSASKTSTAEIPVGNAPHDVVISGQTAFVSNEGGRTAGAVDAVNDSGGTKIVSDPRNGGSITGTVSAVDLGTAALTKTIAVGLHPTGMMLAGGNVFVTNTNSDTISVIDAASLEVVKTIAVQAFPGAPYGSSPTGAAMIDDHQLVVGLGRNNALALYRWNGPAEPVSFEGLVPTGWNPSQVMVDAGRRRLIVVNEKGVGSLGPEASIGPEATGNPTGKWVHSNQGSLSLIPFPAAGQMADYTSTVFRGNSWSASACSDGQRPAAAVGGAMPAQAVIPARIGDPSPIKHVFYIVKENRTYDQVLGDHKRGNGDPNLVQFGE
ncbi:MAG: hypothetical protein ACR2OO_11435, partial [Thermomicrobiales bacterium]